MYKPARPLKTPVISNTMTATPKYKDQSMQTARGAALRSKIGDDINAVKSVASTVGRRIKVGAEDLVSRASKAIASQQEVQPPAGKTYLRGKLVPFNKK